MNELLNARPWLIIYQLPQYAPELNPVRTPSPPPAPGTFALNRSVVIVVASVSRQTVLRAYWGQPRARQPATCC